MSGDNFPLHSYPEYWENKKDLNERRDNLYCCWLLKAHPLYLLYHTGEESQEIFSWALSWDIFLSQFTDFWNKNQTWLFSWSFPPSPPPPPWKKKKIQRKQYYTTLYKWTDNFYYAVGKGHLDFGIKKVFLLHSEHCFIMFNVRF